MLSPSDRGPSTSSPDNCALPKLGGNGRQEFLVRQRLRDVAVTPCNFMRLASTVAEAMSDYWVALATTGDPNGPPTAGKWPRWPRYQSSTDALLEIGPEIAPHDGQARGLRFTRCRRSVARRCSSALDKASW